MKLRYTLRGAAELDKVLVYIEERSPQGARHVQGAHHKEAPGTAHDGDGQQGGARRPLVA